MYKTKSICIFDPDLENNSIHIENQLLYEPPNHQQFSILNVPKKDQKSISNKNNILKY
jgi:hypothetical protein